MLDVTGANQNYQSKDYTTLKELIAAGKLKSIVDQGYPLAQIAAVHRYVEDGHKKGNVMRKGKSLLRFSPARSYYGK